MNYTDIYPYDSNPILKIGDQNLEGNIFYKDR